MTAARDVPAGALFVTRELIDGAKRTTFWRREIDRPMPWRKPELWICSTLLGFNQVEPGRALVRRRVSVPQVGGTFHLTPVRVVKE